MLAPALVERRLLLDAADVVPQVADDGRQIGARRLRELAREPALVEERRAEDVTVLDALVEFRVRGSERLKGELEGELIGDGIRGGVLREHVDGVAGRGLSLLNPCARSSP